MVCGEARAAALRGVDVVGGGAGVCGAEGAGSGQFLAISGQLSAGQVITRVLG